MNIKKVLVIFKTHLDVGFTDFAGPIVDRYMEHYMPDSVRLSEQLRERGGKAQYKWSVGSWLIHEYLRTHPGHEGDVIRRGIENGNIIWHGLPFTTHTELMDPELFEYGLSLSKELDEMFGKKTIAAKMTDVPGHTKAMIPYLKNAGIEFLHIGVNPASAVPKVPSLFRWQADNGDMINVMYQGQYGSLTEIENTGVAVSVCLTNDNRGVHSPEAVEEIFEDLQKKYPKAEIVAGDLNDLALVIRSIQDELPVVTDEIGDTWIHGIGTDPLKVSQYRSLLRLYKELPDCEDKKTLARGLIMIPEHTWGLNIHVTLADHENYDRDDFHEIRKNAPNYHRLEESWKEQRRYITDTVNKLSEPNRNRATALIAEAQRCNCQKEVDGEIVLGTVMNLGSWEIRFNNQGEIDHLKTGGKVLADKKHRLVTLVYEHFSENEYKRFFEQYSRTDETWAHEDFTKPGMSNGSCCYSRYEPCKVSVYPKASGILVRYSFPKEAHRRFGCPLMMDLFISSDKDKELKLDLAWFCKPATRVAESLWVGFRPIASNKRISKIGQLIDPEKVVADGQCRLHGTDYGVVYNELDIETVDTALVAPQEPSLLNFTNAKPFDTDGVYFNLFNNIWDTNFPMWYEEDARFRFVIHLK